MMLVSTIVCAVEASHVQTALTGAHQAADRRAMPLQAYVAEVMRLLEQEDHPSGELLLEGDHARRWAERDGTYDITFAAMNPS